MELEIAITNKPWLTRLHEARERGSFTIEDHVLVSQFPFCFVGERRGFDGAYAKEIAFNSKAKENIAYILSMIAFTQVEYEDVEGAIETYMNVQELVER